ncbi:MAG: hypothetical protein ACKO5F_10105 [Synechococcus sp.]
MVACVPGQRTSSPGRGTRFTAPRLLALLGVVLVAPPALAATETATVV